ncbi:MAG: FAD-dependent 5-carboxymethylaminomethyl-2-thiouridine(34) oxidoreductase MnmC, partial [Rubrivivax sp.]
RLHTAGQTASDMRALLASLQLPPDFVQALDAAQASARCGLRVEHPAWFYPSGGWVQPAALARSFLSRAGGLARFRGSLQVQSLRRADGRWQLLDAAGQLIDQGATLVLANAADALRLLDAAHWPVETVRGQISLLAHATAAPGTRLQLPRVPLAGEGYLLPDVDGLALFGASSQPGDSDGNVRQADHAFNLARLQRLSPQSLPVPAELSAAALQGRVGWRCVAGDRLPLIGAVPDEMAMNRTRTERLCEVPRRDGLYVFTALASRGISWAALGGQVLAAQISGAPWPLESSLTEALDPARFALRVARRPVPRS